MSEVIVRMEIPKDCYDCPMYDFASYRGKLTLCCNAHLDLKPISNNGNPRPSWCPIIGELSEQHGDLIDRDALKSDIIKSLGIKDRRYLLPTENAIWKVIDRQQAVIAAERSET